MSHERVPANQVGICRAVATALSNDNKKYTASEMILKNRI